MPIMYVPKNLKVAHDRLLAKKDAREAKLRQDRDRMEAIRRREKLMKDIAGFYERMEKFFRDENHGWQHSHLPVGEYYPVLSRRKGYASLRI